jgi:hypothetical protein
MSFSGRSNDMDGGAANAARVAARDAKAETENLRGDVERLLLITEALWRIARERWDCTDEELVKRMQEIDLEDGKLDGRKGSSPARDCPHCQRKLIKHQPRCFYCGKPVEFLPFDR